MNESQMRTKWLSAMFDSSFKMDAEATLEWWLSQFSQYKAELREKALLIKDFMQKAICDYAKSKGIEL